MAKILNPTRVGNNPHQQNGSNQFLENIEIDQLKPYGNQARIHSPKQIDKIAASIDTFGFNSHILIDRKNRIICGNGRVAAAKQLGLSTVPAFRLDHLTKPQIRAYILADNQLATLSTWDNEILAIEFQELLAMDLDFDIDVIGFETAEIDLIIGEAALNAQADDENTLPATLMETATSKLDDLWILDEHRLLCGNALEPEAYTALLGDIQAHMVFTDPPYNVPTRGHMGGKGRIRHREFIMAAGEMSDEEFRQFLKNNLGRLKEFTVNGAVLYICMDWRHLESLLAAGREAGLELINVCIWNKDNGGMGSFYRSKHEEVVVFRNGSKSHTNNVQLGKFGRNRTNVWDYPGVNTLRNGRMDELALHPTVKPVDLVADAIMDASHRNDIILDPFCGSGTAIIAAQKTGRRAYCMELDPLYVDVAIRRYQDLHGVDGVHAKTNLTFDEMTKRRSEGVDIPSTEQEVHQTSDSPLRTQCPSLPPVRTRRPA